ncbi:MAG: DUF2497 domain-containing protein [Caulobacterales bacterium]|nr:DUF2497 domain-containing protein [Caulobacterales bacterium]
MSDQNAQEPTMEEILASIRRIISEDDAPADDAAPEAEAVAEAAPEPAPEPEAYTPTPVAAAPAAVEEIEDEEEDDDILDLTDPIPAASSTETHGDLDIYTPEPVAPVVQAAPEPAPRPAPAAPVSWPTDNGLVGEPAARASASAFSNLAAHIAMPASGVTLEDVTRELLKPLLAAWLDEHLPRIVEAKVEEEVQRIARGR